MDLFYLSRPYCDMLEPLKEFYSLLHTHIRIKLCHTKSIKLFWSGWFYGSFKKSLPNPSVLDLILISLWPIDSARSFKRSLKVFWKHPGFIPYIMGVKEFNNPSKISGKDLLQPSAKSQGQLTFDSLTSIKWL